MENVESKPIDIGVSNRSNRPFEQNYFSAPPVFYRETYNMRNSGVIYAHTPSSLTQAPYIGNNWKRFSLKRHLQLHNYLYLQNKLNSSACSSTRTHSCGSSSHILQEYTSMYSSDDENTMFEIEDEVRDSVFEEVEFNYQTFLNVGIALELADHETDTDMDHVTLPHKTYQS